MERIITRKKRGQPRESERTPETHGEKKEHGCLREERRMDRMRKRRKL